MKTILLLILADPFFIQAVYSGVSVYETVINGIAVMRRRADSWLNATQILKVAGVDKGKRTKVLEKEILAGEHEKVQGGYGRYQGTWINYKRAREFCRAYGVEDMLRPLLEYDMGQDGNQPGNGLIETPTKEQAMAAQRKKMMYNGTENNRPLQTPNTTFFKNISTTAANAVSAINKARLDSPGPRPGSGSKRLPAIKRSSQQMSSQDSQLQQSSQQSMQSTHSKGSIGINGQFDPLFGNQGTPYFSKPGRSHANGDEGPPRKRARPSSSMGPFSQGMNGDYDRSMRDTTPTEPNESFVYDQYSQPRPDQMLMGLEPLPHPVSASARGKQQLLASLFIDPAREDPNHLPNLDALSGDDLDIPIDGTGHTALHWAATLAKPALMRALIAKGASIFRVNTGGETALMRAALVTNNLDQNSFPELLELLGPTIEMRDGKGRTVLHHIAVSSAIKGRSSACRYYFDSLLEFVVHQGSASNSQKNSFAPDVAVQQKHRSIGLARFMSEIVNAQDINGDTALNLAARIDNRSTVQQLIEVGANPSIPNRGGLKPLDFGVGMDAESGDVHPSSQNSLSSSQKSPTDNRVGDLSKELMTCKHLGASHLRFHQLITSAAISTVITDAETSFRSELQAKQSLIDKTQTKLREATSTLANERRTLADLEQKVNERNTLKQQIVNLRRSNDGKRGFLASTGPIPRDDVQLGDADAGLTIETSRLRSKTMLDQEQSSVVSTSPVSPAGRNPYSPDQEAYVRSLPPSHVLAARLRAYQRHNDFLDENMGGLRAKSSGLERRLKRIVALSTGIEESKLDEMIGKLNAAIESEDGEEVDQARLREFLRRVENGEA